MVVQSGEDLVYTGSTEGFPPEIRNALEIYVDESGSKAIVITLLHKPETEPNKEKVAFGISSPSKSVTNSLPRTCTPGARSCRDTPQRPSGMPPSTIGFFSVRC